MQNEEPENNNHKAKGLLGKVRKHRLRTIAVLPSMITLLNGICGFAAISFTSRGMLAGVENFSYHRLEFSYFALAGYMIFIGMIADMLDGRVARMSHTTSSFGGQLDSLCDMITFGIAPAFLVLKLLQHKLGGLIELPVPFEGAPGRFIALAAGVYLACAAIRLARFNVENEEDETSHMTFIGLPTPAAAGTLASLVIFYEDMLPSFGLDSMVYSIGQGLILYSLPFITIGTAILMTSRVAYPHVVNKMVKGKKPITYLFWVIAIVGLIFFLKIQTALAFTFCAFALSGVVQWFYTYKSRNGPLEAIEEQQS